MASYEKLSVPIQRFKSRLAISKSERAQNGARTPRLPWDAVNLFVAGLLEYAAGGVGGRPGEPLGPSLGV